MVEREKADIMASLEGLEGDETVAPDARIAAAALRRIL